MKLSLKHIEKLFAPPVLLTVSAGILIMVIYSLNQYQTLHALRRQSATLASQDKTVRAQLLSTRKELLELKNQDQYKINKELSGKIANIEKTYDQAVKTYEKLLDYQATGKKTYDLDKQFAQALRNLSDRNYSSASTTLRALSAKIDDELKPTSTVNTAFATKSSENVPLNNTPPAAGFSQQRVHADVGDFLVFIISADLSSTRVIVDTASESDCSNDCPVLPLGEYAARNGAFAGINGSYFCPAAYPSCAGKTNTFDTLLMNKKKHYFNSDNNVYSAVPAVIFGNGWARFVGKSLEWGRDTGVDGVIANQPLLISGGQITFNGSGDPKHGSRGIRSFVANRASTVYIGVVFNATVAEVSHVLQSMGMENAMNLDSGGSTALWSGGYKVGPGRNIPNAILFVRK